ncbi:MAG TPA: response regulator transcription factor [Anaerolineales bacterium]|nr:response regulator transcription factor [Anaerolineales bacterium]
MTVSILLADDHPIVRQGMRRLLESEADLSVVGEAADGLETVQMVEKLKPNVLIVDMMMPGLNGLEILRHVKKRSPATFSIVLSMQSADSYVVEALKSGASGYILKDTGPRELVNAIHKVIQGERVLSPKLSERLINAYLQTADNTLLDPYETLTDREREVLQLVVEGLTTLEIAKRLSISPRTAELHRGRMMNKLGLRNQTDLIRYALKRGILPMDG